MQICERLSLLGSSRKTMQECSLKIDDDRQRVEEPSALILDVGNGGCHCGKGSINLVVEN